jgi:hypothetical protein
MRQEKSLTRMGENLLEKGKWRLWVSGIILSDHPGNVKKR